MHGFGRIAAKQHAGLGIVDDAIGTKRVVGVVEANRYAAACVARDVVMLEQHLANADADEQPNVAIFSQSILANDAIMRAAAGMDSDVEIVFAQTVLDGELRAFALKADGIAMELADEAMANLDILATE